MKYIIGLGNPGEKYTYTRHNIAWLIFDNFDLQNWKYDKYMNAEFVGGNIMGNLVLYIKPQTFMNKSGEVIATLKKENDFSSDDIIIIYDDNDLAFGKVRVSYNRGDGGHKGVKSITEHVGTKRTIRIRIGISKMVNDNLVKPNVLSLIPKDDQDYIKNIISPEVKNIIESLFREGLEKTMNIFNSK